MRASEIRRGQAVIIDGKLMVVTSADHNTPGNLRAKVQFKMRDVSKGTIQDKRVGATDDIQTATLDRRQVGTEPEALERECAQPELALRGEELRAPEHMDPLAVREVEPQRIERPPRNRRGQARAVGRILEREEDAAPAV